MVSVLEPALYLYLSRLLPPQMWVWLPLWIVMLSIGCGGLPSLQSTPRSTTLYGRAPGETTCAWTDLAISREDATADTPFFDGVSRSGTRPLRDLSHLSMGSAITMQGHLLSRTRR